MLFALIIIFVLCTALGHSLTDSYDHAGWLRTLAVVAVSALITWGAFCGIRFEAISEVEEYKAAKATYEAAFGSEYPFNNENIYAISEIVKQNEWLARTQLYHKYWWNFIPDEVMELEPIAIPEE